MDEYMVVLRLLHIVAGSFWVGASILFGAFIEPAVAALGPAGGAFMGQLTQRKLPAAMAISSTLTIVAGALLYWRNSDGFSNEWITSAPGNGFTVGAIAAVVSYVLGFAVVRPTVKKIGALASAGGGPPPPEMHRLAERLKQAGRANVALLLLAVAAMSVARYL